MSRISRSGHQVPTGRKGVHKVFIISRLLRVLGWEIPPSAWESGASIREEHFGVERLEQHSASLAAAQRITAQPIQVLTLASRLSAQPTVLLPAYRARAAALGRGHHLQPPPPW